METNDKVYNGIYSIVEQRLAANGMSQACSRDAFIAVRNLRLAELNFAELSRLDNRSFIETIYMAMWLRLPTLDERSQWDNDIETMSPQEFQRKFMGYVATTRKSILPNTPSTWDVLLNNIYNKVYLKTPKSFQKFVRAHFKKGK